MKKVNLKKIITRPKLIFTLVLVIGLFIVGNFVFAGPFDYIVGGLLRLMIQGVTMILILLVNTLIGVASYSDFIHAPAVTKGWVVVRDVCNMFFVLILLVISFATILGKEEYSAKKNLPKLILAAILINFSKMICGLMIDLANVFMLTFVNAFKDIGSANMIDMLGISKVATFGKDVEEVSDTNIVVAYIFGLIYVLIAVVVVASMLGMLVMRVVMMWIYIVLSPAAFFLQAVPGKGQQYAAQWWTKWTSNLIIGPVIAFFLWLSFAAMQGDGGGVINVDGASSDSEIAAQSTSQASPITSEAGTTAGFAKFAIGIGLLLGGMKIAQEVGGETGAALGKGMGAINKGKALAVGAATGLAVSQSKRLGRATRDASLWTGGKLINQIGRKEDPVTGKNKGNNLGNFALQWQKDLRAGDKKKKVAAKQKFLEKIGISEDTAEIGKKITSAASFRNIANTASHGASGAGMGAVIGSISGSIIPGVGTLAGAATGAAIGSGIGAATGLTRSLAAKYLGANETKKRKNEASKLVADYETGVRGKSKVNDDKIIADYGRPGPKSVKETEDFEKATENNKQYQLNKKVAMGNEDGWSKFREFIRPTAGDTTEAAFKKMTAKQKRAEDKVKVIANDPEHFSGVGKNGIYRNNGISEDQKKYLDTLNGAQPGSGSNAEKAINNIIAQIQETNSRDSKFLKDEEIEALTKLMAAYKKDDKNTISPNGLGKIDNALKSVGRAGVNTDSDSWKDKVLIDYKQLDSGMTLEKGSGALQYDAFSKNAMKEPEQRNTRKDVMGVSFDQINAKAKKGGLSFSLDNVAGANVEGKDLADLKLAMSEIIDDEISKVSALDNDASKEKVGQLQAAKERLLSGDLSSMRLVNSDVAYSGSQSEARQEHYNTTQHEQIHGAGAKNEELVFESANKLQENKLIGAIPGTKGKASYDTEIGKLIAAMENKGSGADEIANAVAEQINKWKPNNVQRVLETESGERETMSDVIPDGVIETKTAELDSDDKEVDALNDFSALEESNHKLEGAINKLNESLEKQSAGKKSINNSSQKASGMSISEVNFWRNTFNGLKKTISKGDSSIADNLSPLSALTITQEEAKNNKS